MIFVTVGTNEARFERLVEAAGRIPGTEELVIQTGACLAAPVRARCVPFLPYEDMVEHVRGARVVVSHAGVGSIMLSLMAGRRPVVVPRRASFGEAVDDHQVPLARRLDAAGLVRLLEDPADLPQAIIEDAMRAPVGAEGATELSRELHAYLGACVTSVVRGHAA